MVEIYDPSQISDHTMLYRNNVEPRLQSGTEDDFFYTAAAAMPYETEGTFAVIAGNGGLVQFTSGAVAGNRGRINQSVTQLPIDPTHDTMAIVRAKTNQTVNVRHFFGLFDALPTAANPPVEPNNGAYFRRSDAGAVVNWFAVSRKGGVETAVDTGLLGDVNIHDFKITITNGIIQYFIDGALKATINTNVPVVALFYGNVWVTVEAVAKADPIDAWLLYNKRF